MGAEMTGRNEIELHAYYLWLGEGKPGDRADAHWAAAEKDAGEKNSAAENREKSASNPEKRAGAAKKRGGKSAVAELKSAASEPKRPARPRGPAAK